MSPHPTDYGHSETDKELAALLRRLEISYREARISLFEKVEKYMAQFAQEDTFKRALYDSGELSHEDYMAWRARKFAGTKQWRDMLDQLSDDMTNQNRIAASMINDSLPDVYALNHNFGTFEAEKGSGYDTTYTLYDKHTVARLLKGNPDLLPAPHVDIPKDKRWNQQQIQSALLQGLLQGESMSDIANRFYELTPSKTVDDIRNAYKMTADQIAKAIARKNAVAAMRNARTAVTGAENAGRIDSYKRAQGMGIKMRQQWMATLDGRTRDSHVALDGETQEVGKKFSNGCRYPGDPSGPGEEVYNCFVGDTKIATDSEIIRSYKHDYSGELVTIKTARGVEFTCTPNHPIFTPVGWVGANTLHKGDDVFITFVGDEHFSGSNPDVNHVFPRIDAIHNFFNKISCKRVGGLSVNFHGDIPTSEVEIVTHKRLLKDNRYTVVDETGKKFFFKSSNKSFMSKCSFSEHLRRIWFSTLCFMSRLRKALSFFWSRMCHTIVHRFRTISGSDSAVLQSQSDNMSGNVQFSGDGFDRPSCVIFTDNIIDVKISSVSHIPVYNLQTEKNYYFVSSIIADSSQKYNGIPMVIAHNCRCTVVAIVAGADPYDPHLRESAYLKEEGLTYEEWKEKHGAHVERQESEAKINFVPAKTRQEAEEFAKRFARNVDYSGISIENCNAINEKLNELTSKYPINELDTIGGKTRGRAIMRAWYGGIDINRKQIGPSLADEQKQFEALQESRRARIESMRSRYKNAIPKDIQRQIDILEKQLKYSRWSVYNPDRPIAATIAHEYGHILADQYFGQINGSRANPNFDKNYELRGYIKKWDDVFRKAKANGDIYSLSEYGATNAHEFFAESFAARDLGEKLPDYVSELMEEILHNGIM